MCFEYDYNYWLRLKHQMTEVVCFFPLCSLQSLLTVSIKAGKVLVQLSVEYDL